MDKASRNKAIVEERLKNHTTFSALGERFGVTGGRAHQIVTEFFKKLSNTNRVKIHRTILTKSQVATRLGIPEDRLELHI